MLNQLQIGGNKTSLRTFKFVALAGLVVMAMLFSAASCKNSTTDGSISASEKGELPKPSGGGGSPEKFRKGLLVYDDHTKFGDFVIRRTPEYQIDSGTITQLVVRFDLDWDSDTTYTLKYDSTLSNATNIQLPDLKGMFRKCWMTEVDDTSYIENSTSSLNKDTLRTKIVLAKKEE